MSVQLDAVLAKLTGVAKVGATTMACCPAHPDRNPSLAVAEGDDGAVLLTCHAGCSFDQIVTALGLTPADLFPPREQTDKRRVVKTYPYTDEAGDVLYEVVRFDPKDFRQRRPDGNGGHIWNLNGTRRVLYRLPEIIEAATNHATVFVCEGEKDADAIVAAGYYATTAAQGAGKWHHVAEHAAQILAGVEVIVIADRDAAGRAHARQVAESLAPTAGSVIVVEPEIGKDAADHLATGRTIDNFVIIDWNTPPPTDTTDALIDPSFQPIDLGPVLTGDAVQPQPSILHRDDAQCLFYSGQINGVHGDSGVGKGWIVLYAVVQQLTAGRNVLIIDTEDVPTSIIARLRILGVTDTAIRDHLVYIRPTAEFGTFHVDHLIELVTERNVSLVVIDSLGECFGLDAIDENHDAEVGPWLRRVARRLADAGPAVVLVDHGTKAADNPLHPSGSKRKRAAIGGASYLITPTTALSASHGGRLRLTCAKDRHGTYARGEHVADLVMLPTLPGTMRVDLYAPLPSDPDNADLPVELAARAAVTALEKEGHPLSMRALNEAMTIKCRMEAKRAGVDLAIARGLILETPGPRNARLLTLPENPNE